MSVLNLQHIGIGIDLHLACQPCFHRISRGPAITLRASNDRPPYIVSIEFQRARQQHMAAIQRIDVNKDGTCISMAAPQHHAIDQLGSGPADCRADEDIGFQAGHWQPQYI